MNHKYDIHLSAYSISLKSIEKFESLGFIRDQFVNNTHCERTAYHGTYKGNQTLPNNHLWEQLCRILEKDNSFSGGLEEEEFDLDKVEFFSNKNCNDPSFKLPPLKSIKAPTNMYKACDIHISIDIENSDSNYLECFESLNVASFDKLKDGRTFRIYTITTEALADGLVVFETLSNYLKKTCGIKGKIKFERTTRFFRKPSNSNSLPLTLHKDFESWLSNLNQK